MTADADLVAPARHIDEPLTATAERAWRVAPEQCDHGRGCAPYHRLWPTLRLLGLGADPLRHVDFFTDALRAAAADGAVRRVLVSGASDQCMPALISAVLDGPDLEMTVVDPCSTPLTLITSACSGETNVRTEAQDVRTLPEPAAFDVVCTHSLLTMLRPADRAEVIDAWAQLLRPGGRAITVARIAAQADPGAADPAAFAETVRRRAASSPGVSLPAPPEDLAAAAEAYARWTVVHPIRSLDELTRPMEAAGFTIEVRCREVAGPPVREGLPGGTARRATYAELVATRG